MLPASTLGCCYSASYLLPLPAGSNSSSISLCSAPCNQELPPLNDPSGGSPWQDPPVTTPCSPLHGTFHTPSLDADAKALSVNTVMPQTEPIRRCTACKQITLLLCWTFGSVCTVVSSSAKWGEVSQCSGEAKKRLNSQMRNKLYVGPGLFPLPPSLKPNRKK